MAGKYPLLNNILETRFTQGCGSDWVSLRAFLEHPKFPGRAKEFKQQLADAIVNHGISPAEFEELTSIDQDEQADVDQFLLEELWENLYDGEDPGVDAGLARELRFTVEEKDERPWATFPSEPGIRGWLLSAFLEEARPRPDLVLEEIHAARANKEVETGFTGNHVDIQFFGGRAVIVGLYPTDPDGDPERIELGLEEAQALVEEWSRVLAAGK